MAGDGLWDRNTLGSWNDRSPVWLYAHFLRAQRGELAEKRRNEYARLLMNVVAIQFGQHGWRKRLPEVRLNAEEVAQEVLIHLLRKVPRMLMQHAGWRPMMGALNTTIVRYVLGAVKGARRRARELTATDYADPNRSWPGELADPNGTPQDDEQENSIGAITVRLSEALRSEDACDRVLGDIRTRNGAEADALEAMFVFLRERLIGGMGMVCHSDLPPDIRSEVSLELHALCIARLNRIVREFVR